MGQERENMFHVKHLAHFSSARAARDGQHLLENGTTNRNAFRIPASVPSQGHGRGRPALEGTSNKSRPSMREVAKGAEATARDDGFRLRKLASGMRSAFRQARPRVRACAR